MKLLWMAVALAICAGLLFCTAPATQSKTNLATDTLPAAFAGYWYQGLAELNTYSITQNRYGEPREGKAVWVFVTEDFSRKKQVKLDAPDKSPNDKQTMLKLNDIRRFTTGIYDYSLMTSTFSPVQGGAPSKITCSVQDWCGQVFAQLNRRGNGFEYEGYSYFESAGDFEKKLKAELTEESILTTIRLSPDRLPLGNIQLLPSQTFFRLCHVLPEVFYATATKSIPKNGIQQYQVTYTKLQRTFIVDFKAAFPHQIVHWTETYNNKPFIEGQLLTTRQSAYWKENTHTFDNLRDTLQVPNYW